MKQSHGHEHHGPISPNRLLIAVLASVAIMIAELVAGFAANSLALLSDAGHMFTDILALSLSWYGLRQASRPATARMTYGYHRVGIVVALVNAALIALIALIIIYESYQRFRDPQEVNSVVMFAVATLGLAANVGVVLWLRTQARRSLNIRSAFMHAAGDALASVGVIVGGLAIYFTDAFWLDPLISVIIVIIILGAAWQIAREALNIVLESAPRDLDVDKMITAMKQVTGANNVHDLHVWSLTPELRALSCHMEVDDTMISQSAELLRTVQDILMDRFGICHVTIQLECTGCETHPLYCRLGEPMVPREHPPKDLPESTEGENGPW